MNTRANTLPSRHGSRRMRLTMQGITAVSILATTGCLSHAELVDRMAKMSSGPTGCEPQTITVTNEDEGGGFPVTWTANCNNAHYACSANAVGPAACDLVKPQLPVVAPQAPLKTVATWERYRINECGISFMLPGKPTLQRETVQTSAGPMTSVTAVVELAHDSGAVAASCAAIPGGSPFDSQKVLNGGRDKTLESMGATFDREESINTSDFTGRDIRFHVQGKDGRMRIYLRGRNVVSLVMIPTTSFGEPETAAYFDGLAVATPKMASRP